MADNNTTVFKNNMEITGNLVVDGSISATSEGFTGAQTITATSANALAVGRQGTTAPAFNVSTSTASSATGIGITAAAAGGGVAVAATSSGTDESVTIDAKGAGTVTVNGTATGGITLGRAVTLSSTINKVTLTAPASAATLTLINSTVVTGPAATGTLATLAGSETFTNKTITSPTITGGTITGATISGQINGNVARCSASLTKNASTTYANVTGLTATVVAGTYQFTCYLPSTVASGTAGIKYAFNYTTTVLSSIEATGRGSTSAAQATQHTTTTTTQADLFSQAAVVLFTEITGTMVVTTGGTIDLQMAQNTSNASDTVTLVGASMSFTRIS